MVYYIRSESEVERSVHTRLKLNMGTHFLIALHCFFTDCDLSFTVFCDMSPAVFQFNKKKNIPFCNTFLRNHVIYLNKRHLCSSHIHF